MNTYAIGIAAGIIVLIVAFFAPAFTGLSVGVDTFDVNFESGPLDSVPAEFNTVGTAEGGFIETDAFITSGGKPVLFFFGTMGDSDCSWEKKPFLEVAKEFGDSVSVHFYEHNIATPTADDTEVLTNLKVGGNVPVVMIAGRYYRIGSGERYGEEGEKQILRGLIEDVLNQV